MGNELQKMSDFFVKEQEWAPGYRAPMFLYMGTVVAAFAFIGGAFLIYQWDKTQRDK